VIIRGGFSSADERRRWWLMVNVDPGRHGLSAVLLTALLGCGCLQTQTGEGPFKTTAGGFSPKGAAPDSAVVLAVAKPAPGGVASSAGADTTPARAAEGPDLNPVQPASATADPPADPVPPRPMPNAPGEPPAVQTQPGQTPPAPGQPNKDATNAAPPANATVPPAQARPPLRYNPDPTLTAKKATPYPPAGLAQAGGVQPGGYPNDPHQRPVPTASGSLLNLQPGESPAERALELNARLMAADADRQVLDRRARELTVALEERDRALVQHTRDIHEAADEVAKAREQVTNWRKELEEARAKLRTRELDDVQTLKAIITLLERLTEAGQTPDARHDAGAVRMPPEE
jgi:hypothetical protein